MNINDIVTEYAAQKAMEAAAKKRAAALKALIMDHAAGGDYFETDDFRVFIKSTTSTRLDSERLYKDFPDIKAEYGKTSTSYTIDAHMKAEAGKMPA